MRLGALAWPEVGRPVLAVPVGATEQHGRHLPLDTDTRIAVALSDGLAGAAPGVVVAPALPYTSSGEHAGFPGTLSIGQDATEHLIVELVRSADFAAGVVLVCWHGGNGVPLRRATSVLQAEGRRVLCWTPSVAGGDAHAGRTETSMLLALAPSLVRLDRAVAGERRPLAELRDRLESDGVAAVAPNGVLGDPAGASATEGRSLFADLLADLRAAVDGWPR